MSSVLIIFTSKQLHEVVELSGTGWWKIDPVKARKATHVVLTHNAHDKRRPGQPERHGDSFMIGTIRDLKQDEDGRWLIQLKDFAETDAGLKWPGYRNPVTYADADETLAQVAIGDWHPMEVVPFEDAQALRRRDDASLARMRARERSSSRAAEGGNTDLSFGEIIEVHREGLARDLGVDPSAVRISIEPNG